MSVTSRCIKANVFSTSQHRGTRAALFSDANNLTEQQMLALAKDAGCEASVFIIGSGLIPQIRIFNAITEIQWCGHGLLAAAHFLKQTQNIKQIQLSTGLIDIDVFNRNGEGGEDLWLGFEPLKIHQGLPEDIQKTTLLDAFNYEPINYAHVGDENSYLILEWSENINLSSMDVNFESLKNACYRAVIATQKANNGYDFKLRYFAPHHGANEDPATGSANRVLATYWHEKLFQYDFAAEQVSKNGAVILSKIEKNKVWISGKVELI